MLLLCRVVIAEGAFQSEALLVPEQCVFDHVHNASRCWSYDEWNATAAAACVNRDLKLRSFAILLPCGVDLFSGVEFVCCPRAANLDDVSQSVAKSVDTEDDDNTDDDDDSDEDSDEDDDDDATTTTTTKATVSIAASASVDDVSKVDTKKAASAAIIDDDDDDDYDEDEENEVDSDEDEESKKGTYIVSKLML